MKIGIITVHNSPNYGASLQAYALWKYIIQSADCEIIDLYRPYQKDYIPSARFRPMRGNVQPTRTKIKRLIKKLLNYTPKHFSVEAKAKFDEFNSQIKLSKTYKGIDALYANPPQYDLYISGSDQLWNPAQPYCMEPYFLTFTPQTAKKISYATSIGISELKGNEKKLFKEWLSSYDAISVRERQAKRLLESFTNRKDIVQVADPTFLLDVDEWKQMAVYPNSRKPYILLFILSYSKSLIQYALKLCREGGLRLVVVNQLQPLCTDGSYDSVTDAGPREFLGYIANADMVMTDSFHGTVFSIIMGTKNFYTYIAPGNKRGSRITDLLDMFGLQDHLLPTELDRSYDELTQNVIDRSEELDTIRKVQADGRNFLDLYIK